MFKQAGNSWEIWLVRGLGDRDGPWREEDVGGAEGVDVQGKRDGAGVRPLQMPHEGAVGRGAGGGGGVEGDWAPSDLLVEGAEASAGIDSICAML